MDHLAQEFSTSPEHGQTIQYATLEYFDLLESTSKAMPPNHSITYVPFRPEQQTHRADHLNYFDRDQLPDLMQGADMVIAISRDEESSPSYTDQYPEYNITLTPSGRSNVDTSVSLYNMARDAGNEHVQFLATGRMHNRAVQAMLALPLVAEYMGINAEDFYHMSEPEFKDQLYKAFTPDRVADLQIAPNDSDDELINASQLALAAILKDSVDGIKTRSVNSTSDELRHAADRIWDEYQKYPRVSTSRLMVERAIHEGVLPEVIYEDDGAVDTITNLINVSLMLRDNPDLRPVSEPINDADSHRPKYPVRRIVIVAGSDHLPRTTWIADHILPDGIEIVCVEADPALNQEDYNASCVRELGSFNKGSKWIGDTRDLGELQRITEEGYFSPKRKSASEIAGAVATAATDTSSAN